MRKRARRSAPSSTTSWRAAASTSCRISGAPSPIIRHIAGARKLGMSDAQFGELRAVVGMFNQTNKLVEGYQVQVDERIRRFVQGEDGKGPLPREASAKGSGKAAPKRAAAHRADLGKSR